MGMNSSNESFGNFTKTVTTLIIWCGCIAALVYVAVAYYPNYN